MHPYGSSDGDWSSWADGLQDERGIEEADVAPIVNPYGDGLRSAGWGLCDSLRDNEQCS